MTIVAAGRTTAGTGTVANKIRVAGRWRMGAMEIELLYRDGGEGN